MAKIADLLPIGRENAISSKDLANLAGFSNVRDLQYAIARERRRVPILSACDHGGGYFLPASIDEIKTFIRTLEARSWNTLEALRSAKEALALAEIENAAPDATNIEDGMASGANH